MIVNIKSRTVENEIKEDEGIKLTQATSETLKRYWPNRHNFNNHIIIIFSSHGININNPISHKNKCKENEIFLMNKNKMFLVSSEKIVHDISGGVSY